MYWWLWIGFDEGFGFKPGFVDSKNLVIGDLDWMIAWWLEDLRRDESEFNKTYSNYYVSKYSAWRIELVPALNILKRPLGPPKALICISSRIGL